MTFPEDSLQSLIHPSEWWIKNENKVLCRGCIIFAFIPYVDQVPYSFEPVGRTNPTEHESAKIRVAPLKVDQPLTKTDLPVAAMTLHDSEVWAAYRAKKRPCLVVSMEGIAVEKSLTRGKTNHSTAPTFLAAPYYGVQGNLKRSGYSEEFVERVRHCEYPQFHWDILPIPKGEESILRLDHLQPIGAHHNAYAVSGYMLSSDAMDLIDELIRWLIWGGVEEDSILLDYRRLIEDTFGS